MIDYASWERYIVVRWLLLCMMTSLGHDLQQVFKYKRDEKEKVMAIWRVQMRKNEVDDLRTKLRYAEETYWRVVEEHLKEHPLTADQRRFLMLQVAAGRQLCCEDGRKFLSIVVDEVWAEVINTWAYERLGCTGREDLPRAKRLLIEFFEKPVVLR